ncbi:unnamed protein product [Rotaria sp. Silwood1]|nr:unnamed protein product [Rotaria sp. Silwood1]
MCSQVAFIKDYRSAVFDIPSELDEQLQSYWKDRFSRSSNGLVLGGSYTGSRNSERSNACFKCQKEGHKSFDCSEPKKGRSSANISNRGIKRSFTGNQTNGHSIGETSRKKNKI